MEKTYQIRVNPNYYHGTWNAPQPHYLRYGDLPKEHADYDERCELIVKFASRQAAEDVIKQLAGDGVYLLSHGEHAAPDYTVVEDADNWGDDCVAHGGAMGSDWDEIDVSEVPAEALAALEEVDYDKDDGHYQIWSAETTLNDVDYAISYAVNPLAIQSVGGEMGSINWANATYYRHD